MKDALLALSARTLFFFHGILAFYTVYTELKNMEGMWMIWFLLIPNFPDCQEANQFHPIPSQGLRTDVK